MARKLTIEEIMVVLEKYFQERGIEDCFSEGYSDLEKLFLARQRAKVYAEGSRCYPEGFSSVDELMEAMEREARIWGEIAEGKDLTKYGDLVDRMWEDHIDIGSLELKTAARHAGWGCEN